MCICFTTEWSGEEFKFPDLRLIQNIMKRTK